MMRSDLLSTIGNTPLVTIPFPHKCTVMAKLEYLNPSGSIKDRSALYMLEKAEKDGVLKPGGTIVEASSGNQGIAVAMIGRIKGYRVIILMPDTISIEKRQAVTAYGAELLLCKGGSSIEDPTNYRNQAHEIAAKIPGSFVPNQYFNLQNPEAHYGSLGPEIWKQTDGKITHFVAAAGTGGTVSGVAKYLKERDPSIKVIGVDVATSFRSTNGNPKPYMMEGIGVDFDTPCLNKSIIDDFIPVSDEDGFSAMIQMSREYGFLVGTAAGAVCSALLYTLLPTLDENARVVTIFTDSGRSYFSKQALFHNRS